MAIAVPAMVAIARPLVVFSLDEQRYALDLERVVRVIRAVALTPLPEAPPIVLGVVDLGGEVTPVIDLRRRFEHRPRAMRLADHLLVANTGRRTVALLVDETTEVLAATPENLGAVLPGHGPVNGAMKLADGLVLIHDLDRLLSLDEETAIDHALDARDHPRGAAP